MKDLATTRTLILCLSVAVALEAIGQIETAARMNLVQAAEEARGKTIQADNRACSSCHRVPMTGSHLRADKKATRDPETPGISPAYEWASIP